MSAARPFILCSAAVIGVALLGVYLGAAESPKSAVKAPDMSQRVATLEDRVARLEKLLSQLVTPGGIPMVAPQAPQPSEAPGAALTPQAPQTYPAPTTPQLPPGIPLNAQPFQFNGSTYYIVPLAKEAAHQ
jgi:hypothetical protein